MADERCVLKLLDFHKIGNIYPDRLLEPMVIVLKARYMFVQHVPIMYLTYT